MRIFYVYPILIQMLTLITCEMLSIKDVANSSRSVWYEMIYQLVLNLFACYVIKYIDNNFVLPYVEIVLA